MSDTSATDKAAYDAAFPDGFVVGVRRELSIQTVLVALAVCLITSLGLQEVLRNPFNTSSWGFVALGSPALTGAWMALEQLWRPSTIPSLQRFMLRQLAFGVLFALVNAAVHAVVGRGAAAYGNLHAHDDRTPTAGGLLRQAILAFDLIGIAASLAGGTIFLVLVIVPVMSLRSPQEFAEMNALSTADEDLPSARFAGLVMSALIVVVFAVPTLIVVGHRNDSTPTLWVGILLVPSLVVLVFVAAVVQRPDPAMGRVRRLQWWKH